MGRDGDPYPTGGRWKPRRLLMNVAATLREREYLRRQVKALSAEGRLSAWILGGLPPGFVIYLTLANPSYLQPMVSRSMGWLMIGAATVMMVIGVFWMTQDGQGGGLGYDDRLILW